MARKKTAKLGKSSTPCIRKYSGPLGDSFYVTVRGNGKRYTQRCSTLTDAKNWRDEVQGKLRSGIDPDAKKNAGKHTLADEIRSYMKSVERGGDEIGRDYLRQFEWWINSSLGNVPLIDINRDLLLEARDQLMVKPNGNPRSPATVNRYLAVISKVLNAAASKNKIQRIVFRSKSLPKHEQIRFAEPAGREQWLKEDQIQPLLDACSQTDPRLHALVVLALETGARAGELLNLERKNIHLDDGVALAEDTKNGEDRELFIGSPEAVKAVRTMLKITPLTDPRLFGDWHYRWDWKRATQLAGIPGFRFHDLRHTAASILHNSGVALEDVGTILGHKSGIVMTRRYAHTDRNRLADVMRNKGVFAGKAE